MASLTHPSVVDGWFREINTQWPGQALTLKVNKILHHEKSLYQDVLVFESETYGNVLILDGVVQCTERDEFSYQEMITHLPMASHPNPEHVLVIGGGDGGVVREVLKHSSVKHVTLCDIDEAVVRVSKQYLPHMSAVLDDPKVTVFIGDGFKFLPEHENSYDVIITDSSDPVGPAQALFEAPYFSLLKKALKEGGNMSTQGECLWLHLPLIKELRETTKKLFPVAEYAYTTIPTYPSGQIGFVCCSLDSKRSVSTPLREVPGCKYYNSKLHQAAFVLPEFGRAMVEEGKMIQPSFAGVRPGAEKDEVGSGVVGGTANEKKTGAAKKVLLLGSGLVAGPCAEYVTRKGYELTIGCRTLQTAQEMCSPLREATPISIDVTDAAALDAAVAKHDLVISLVPYIYHAQVIESAIRNKKHVVTTSYVSPAMKALDEKCKEAGIVVFNEIGLDPGTDHVEFFRVKRDIKKKGGLIRSFKSMAGGLCHPALANNPLAYKFSWAPAGVLLALKNNAKYLENGKVVEIEGKDLMSAAKPYLLTTNTSYNLYAYANRDSTPFVEYYGIPEAHTCIRGSMRYPAFLPTATALNAVGLLDRDPRDWLAKGAQPLTWLEVVARALGADATESSVVNALKKLPGFQTDTRQKITQIKRLGLLSDQQAPLRGTLLDTLSAYLEKALAFGPGEQDLVILQHTFEVEYPDGTSETRTSTLEMYGEVNGPSAMAKTVGVPCGIAVDLVLRGVLNKVGVQAPYDYETCDILRPDIEAEGIVYVEEIF